MADDKQQELLDTIGNMTVLELAEFVDAFKEKFNVEAPVAAAAPAAAGAAGPAAEGEAAAAQEEFDVVLDDAGDKKIQVIKVIREVSDLGLKEAKELVDGAPSTIKEGVEKEEAEELKSKLEEEGAQVTLK